jgi:hypothetical protein
MLAVLLASAPPAQANHQGIGIGRLVLKQIGAGAGDHLPP